MEKLDAVLADLAVKLGTTVEALWPKLIAYWQAEAVAGAVVCSVVALATGLTCKTLATNAIKIHKEDKWANEGMVAGLTVSSVVAGGASIITTIFSFVYIYSAILALVAPEGYAVTQLVRMLSGN